MDLNAEPLTPEELETIKVITNAPVLELTSKFFENIAPLTKITINDIFITFNLKEDKYPRELVNVALNYFSLSDSEQQEIAATLTQENLDTFKEIADSTRNNLTLLLESPFTLFRVLVAQGIVDNEPVGLFNDFLDILVSATYPRISKDRLFMSDFSIWLELFTRIFVKQQGAIGKTFFIQKGIDFLKKNIPILNFMKKEGLIILKNFSEL